MNFRFISKGLALALITAALASADVVQTRDGAKLVGKIKAVNGGAVTLDTSYAGTLTIKQSEIVSMQTDAPRAVRLASGTRIDGTMTTTAEGTVQITGTDGTITTTVPKVAMLWPVGATDPLIGAWSYEATADIEGTTGNKTSLTTGGSFTAELQNPSNDLKYYAAYDRAVSEGVESADQFKAGVDYAELFAPDQQWFVRDEAGFDRVMGIRYEDVAAGGYGFDVVKTKTDVFLARAGVAYRYDDYDTPNTPTVSDISGDLELEHDYKGASFEVHNALTWVPAFRTSDGFLATQDSYVQVPLKNLILKFRAGMSNNYNSKPGTGIQRLDTLYYLRLVCDFGAPAAP